MTIGRLFLVCAAIGLVPVIPPGCAALVIRIALRWRRSVAVGARASPCGERGGIRAGDAFEASIRAGSKADRTGSIRSVDRFEVR